MREECLMSEDQETLYAEFVNWAAQTEFGALIFEGRFTDKLKTVISFVKDFAVQVGFKLKEMIEVFLDKHVFSFFSEFDWSISSFMDFLKKTYEIWKKVVHIIPDFISHLAKQGLDILNDVNNKSKFAKIIRSIEDFFGKHPVLKRISGLALAGLLIFIWLNMSFIGDPLNDFDMSDILSAILGKLSFVEFFTSENGIKTLILFATGALGLSVSWFTTPANILIAITTTIAKSLKKRLAPASPREIFRDLSGLANEQETPLGRSALDFR